jgi:hypothetical protein
LRLGAGPHTQKRFQALRPRKNRRFRSIESRGAGLGESRNGGVGLRRSRPRDRSLPASCLGLPGVRFRQG